MKLQRQAKNLLFDQLIRKTWISSEKLYRFMLTSKSNASVVRKFLNGSTVKYNGYEFYIILEQLDLNLLVSDEALLTVLKLLRPQGLKLLIVLDNDVERLETVLPYLDGVTKLEMLHTSSSLLSRLVRQLPQLKELECRFEALIFSSFVLNLDKLIVNGRIQDYIDSLLCIFCHNIKILDFQIFLIENNEQGPLINESNVGRASVEHLILHVGNTSSPQTLLPIFTNFCNYFPKLKKLNVEIDKVRYLDGDSSFADQLVVECENVMSLKNQLKHLLSELTVELSITLECFENEEYQADWEMALSRAKQFGNVLPDKQENGEKVDLSYFEKIDQMLFTLKLKLILTIFDEEQQQIIIDDNLDFDELDLDVDDDLDFDDDINYDDYEYQM